MTEIEHHDITSVTFSFVVPVYNEAESLPAFCAKLRSEADKLGQPYEIIFVDDGSTDESPEIIRSFHEDDDRVRYVSFSRNFGPQEAITAGYDYATGSAVISLDADGQHPPEVIAELAAKWRQGYEVVCTVKAHTKDVSLPRRLAVKCVYRLIRLLTGMDVTDQTDFRLLDRKAVDAVRRVRERSRFLRGLVRWVGFRQTQVRYEVADRLGGTPGYTLTKLARMGSAGLFNFSAAPLRLIGLVGVAMAALAFVYAVVALILWPVFGGAIIANLVMLAIGLTGMQLAAVGICGEYVGRIYDEAKGRPIYVVREAVGFEQAEEKTHTQLQPSRIATPTEPSKIRLFT
ncbi:MAG: glycosyltransferase family 2 protein [Planctomycetota bacterium]|nr:glycosyltransferase family 2 protein [Planctomycetota bacterium]